MVFLACVFLYPFFTADQQIEIFGTDVFSSEPIVKAPDEILEEESLESEREGGGCLIATATYGTELAPQVQMLREIRDNLLLQTSSGTTFMTGFNEFYYSFSPTIADWEKQNPIFKEAVKIAITPMISSLSIMSLAENGSESDVLAYGISLILLNVGMYFVAPTIVVYKIRKRI